MPAELFNDDRARQTLDLLPAYERDLQSQVGLRLITTFSVPVDEILYDITSLYFEGVYEDSQLIRLGYSRDKKPEKKQVNLGLTTSREGGCALAIPDPARQYRRSGHGRSQHQGPAPDTAAGALCAEITDGGRLSPENVHRLEQQDVGFVGPWQADTALLDLLQEANVEWEKMPYRGSRGQSE